MSDVVREVRALLTTALEAGELRPATITRLLATVHAHAQAAGITVDLPEPAPVEPEEPAVVLVPMGAGRAPLSIDQVRDLAWSERRRRADVDG